jgi:hypothetical protein
MVSGAIADPAATTARDVSRFGSRLKFEVTSFL